MSNKKNDNKIIENKVALSFREYENKKVLFRLFNTKREKSKSFNIYEKAKFSTTIKLAFNNDYRKVDIEYDTTKNNRFKKVNLLIDLNSYLDKSKKNLYLDLINSNKEFIKKNKVDNSIIENIKFFEEKIKSL
tara:strand:- start:219 stop:617 length:399 start_codon:yes stop_codon:yes gene_type:complete